MALQQLNYGNPFETLMQGLGFGQEFMQKRKMNPLLIEEKQLANAFNQFKNQHEAERAQFYPQFVQAELSKAQAEPREMNARAGLYGSQANEINQLLPGRREELNLKNQYYPDIAKSQNALREAQARKASFELENPLHGQAGAAGQIGAIQWLQQHPEIPNSSEYLDIIKRNLNAGITGKNALADLYEKKAEGYKWNQLPAETRNGIVAQGLGMGIDPAKMMSYVNEGKDIKQIAEAEGLDPENLPPARYFPTQATKSRVQLVEQVGNELDYLSSATTPIIKRYADTFGGYSPERIKDMLSSDPEAQDRFGEYIGALSVQTGIANGRVALEGGKAGVTVMEIVKKSALKGIDDHSPIVMTGRAFEKAQKTIDRILQKGAKIRTNTGMSPLRLESNQGKDFSNMSNEELIKIATGGQ